jgi:hypothetical protein
MDAELKSEAASAAAEGVGQSQAVSPPVESKPGSEPPIATLAGDATPGAPLPLALSVEAVKKAPPGEGAKDAEVRVSPAVTAPSTAAPGGSLEDALAALDRKDYATAKRLFEALGRKGTAAGIEDALAALDRKDYASANRLFEALGQKSATAAPEPAAPSGISLAAGGEMPRQKPPSPKLDFIPLVDPTQRRARSAPQPANRRRLMPALLAAGLILALVAGAPAVLSPRLKSMLATYAGPLQPTLALASSKASEGLASAAGVLKGPWDAITGPSRREEEERTATRDLSAALTQATIRLDQIEHDYAARIDKLGERLDQNGAYRIPDIVQRLDRLEQRAAAPAPPVSEFADVVARLDRLEKRPAAGPAPESPDLNARLDKLEKRATISVMPSEITAVTARLDRLEKKLSVASASSPMAVPPTAPKPSTLVARAEPYPPNDIPRSNDNSRPLLRNFSIEEVRDGVAVVDTRDGPQQVGPGDLIPGAGRVLRIERHGGDWFVVTSVGVIAGDPGAY